MKNYTITVNGNVYDVTVQEAGSAAPRTIPAAAPQAAPAPAAQPAAQPAPQPAAPQPAAPAAQVSGTAGAIKVEAGAQGKIFKIEASVGQAVKKGDTVVILEAMKMEIPVVAPEDGTVASINVNAGDLVAAGTLLATLN